MMWQSEVDKWLKSEAKWCSDFFLLFEPPDDEKFAFIFVVTVGRFSRGLHAFPHFFCLQTFVVFFDRFPLGALLAALFNRFLSQLFADAALALERFFFWPGTIALCCNRQNVT